MRVLALSLAIVTFGCKKESKENEMTVAHARRKSHSLTSYTIQQEIQGVMNAKTRGSVILTVEDNKITDVRRADDGVSIPQEQWVSFSTIDELFVLVDNLKKYDGLPNGIRLEVSYDAEYGYPKKIIEDWTVNKSAMDDVYVTVASEDLKF